MLPLRRFLFLLPDYIHLYALIALYEQRYYTYGKMPNSVTVGIVSLIRGSQFGQSDEPEVGGN